MCPSWWENRWIGQPWELATAVPVPLPTKKQGMCVPGPGGGPHRFQLQVLHPIKEGLAQLRQLAHMVEHRLTLFQTDGSRLHRQELLLLAHLPLLREIEGHRGGIVAGINAKGTAHTVTSLKKINRPPAAARQTDGAGLLFGIGLQLWVCPYKGA